MLYTYILTLSRPKLIQDNMFPKKKNNPEATALLTVLVLWFPINMPLLCYVTLCTYQIPIICMIINYGIMLLYSYLNRSSSPEGNDIYSDFVCCNCFKSNYCYMNG